MVFQLCTVVLAAVLGAEPANVEPAGGQVCVDCHKKITRAGMKG